jgi:cyclic pyranopterin phosphate synthase
MKGGLSHVDEQGQARVVDVGEKSPTRRRAVASAQVGLSAAALRSVTEGSAKGDVLGAARIAGLMAVKRVPDLIPLCHTVSVTHAAVDLALHAGGVTITATVEAIDRTGVELEAITAATVAALTLYDMLKAVDRGIVIEQVMLLEKHGGRSGSWVRADGAGP